MNENNPLPPTEHNSIPPSTIDQEVYNSIRLALTKAQASVVVAINSTMVEIYWEIGKGFTEVSLRNMRQFYAAFPIRSTLRSELS
ncbi:MAG: hypothetical protein FWE02_07905 [Defluviitaleaceae bacterium]|nr:hypothetical protein [Defluviitaleaceae bacterium]